jgi:hypothetical protein
MHPKMTTLSAVLFKADSRKKHILVILVIGSSSSDTHDESECHKVPDLSEQMATK